MPVPQHIERGSLYQQDFPEQFYTGVPIQLLSQRPDAQYAESSLKQAYYATAEARSAMYPSITLGGGGE